jgi:hypothetical protein
LIYEDSYATPPYPLLYHTITENNIYKNIKFDTKKAGFTRPASTFFIIQLSNSRVELPQLPGGYSWHVAANTGDKKQEIYQNPVRISEERILVGPRSVIVLEADQQ